MSSDEEVVVCKSESPAVVVCMGFGLMASITTRFGEVPAMLFGTVRASGLKVKTFIR